MQVHKYLFLSNIWIILCNILYWTIILYTLEPLLSFIEFYCPNIISIGKRKLIKTPSIRSRPCVSTFYSHILSIFNLSMTYRLLFLSLTILNVSISINSVMFYFFSLILSPIQPFLTLHIQVSLQTSEKWMDLLPPHN